MEIKENLVFLGMMGSGKSSIGSMVSKKLKLPFFDVDKEIESMMKSSISKIFEVKGEDFFRKLEQKITLKILKKKNCIISLGGGAFLNKRIRKEILKNHLSFWLQWDAKTLINRLKDSTKRPIATKSTNEELIDLIKKRSNIYSKALYTINCNGLKKNEVVNEVLKLYGNK